MRAYLLAGRPIHFPFLSGLLEYSCPECDAPCCKGTALGIGRSRELVTLKEVQPNIPLFATPSYAGSAMLSLQAPREACWFLDKKARCRLEKVIGRAAKPAGCRLFPFQRIRSLGETVTVLPDFMCPITVAAAPTEAGDTSHDELCLEMHRTQVPREGHAELPAPHDLPWAAAVPLERRIISASTAHLGGDSYVAFSDVQLALTATALGADLAPGYADRLDRRIRGFLGFRGVARDAAGVHDHVALTGVLRLMTSAIARQEMPAMMLALSALLDGYASMRGSKRSARTVVSLYEQRLPLIYVLSHLPDAPRLKEGVRPKRLVGAFPAVRAPLLEILRDIVDNKSRKGAKQKSLEHILNDQGDTFSPPLSFDAVAMLYGLGHVLLHAGDFGRL